MKIKDLAAELGKPVKDLIRLLEEVDVKVKSPMTKLDDETVSAVRDLFKDEKVAADAQVQASPEDSKIVILEDSISLKDLAHRFGIPLSDVMRAVLQKGLALNLNSLVDVPTATELARHLGIELEMGKTTERKTHIRQRLEKIEESEMESIESLQDRPPVITIMGHVDHGKTQLLDTIRKTNVMAKEAGGITQHIGAYQVTFHGRKLTFLDTPGHAAFTALRARGAQVTDIVILVVAGDEGIKPQTVEALDHAKAAGVPILVAVNKMDKPDADLDRVKQQLAEHDLVAEDWGGKTVIVPISAKTGQGISELLDMILLSADMLELKANPDSMAQAVVIESRLSRRKGPVATVIVKTGTLRVGDLFAVGTITGRVRAMLNDLGESVSAVGPGTPTEILGLTEVPHPGDFLEVVDSEKALKVVVESHRHVSDRSSRLVKNISLESMSRSIHEGQVRRLNLIVKADVNGSLEAVLESIKQIPTHDIQLNVLHAATGPVIENDVVLARASEAIIIGFGVGVNADAQRLAEEEGIEVKTYAIIYQIIEDIEKVLVGMFRAEYEDVDVGQLEVRQLYHFSKIGTILGSYVLSGRVKRNDGVRVMRGKNVLGESKVETLKRFKEDVKEVTHGYECGVVLADPLEVEVGDRLILLERREKRRK